MTTSPEQTAPPLSEAELTKVRALAEGGAEGATSSTHYRGSVLSVLRLLGMYDRAMADLAEARRQRDERPAGRVVAKVKTIRPLNAKPGAELHQSRLTYVSIDAPIGTEVAVVVVADDSGEGE